MEKNEISSDVTWHDEISPFFFSARAEKKVNVMADVNSGTLSTDAGALSANSPPDMAENKNSGPIEADGVKQTPDKADSAKKSRKTERGREPDKNRLEG